MVVIRLILICELKFSGKYFITITYKCMEYYLSPYNIAALIKMNMFSFFIQNNLIRFNLFSYSENN